MQRTQGKAQEAYSQNVLRQFYNHCWGRKVLATNTRLKSPDHLSSMAPVSKTMVGSLVKPTHFLAKPTPRLTHVLRCVEQ